MAKRRGDIPVISLLGWTVTLGDGSPVPDPPTAAATPAEAVELALRSR